MLTRFFADDPQLRAAFASLSVLDGSASRDSDRERIMAAFAGAAVPAAELGLQVNCCLAVSLYCLTLSLVNAGRCVDLNLLAVIVSQQQLWARQPVAAHSDVH